MSDQIEFSESIISSNVVSPHSSIEDIITIANNIWNEVKTAKNTNDGKELNDRLVILQTKYNDFNSSFPLILRWMVQMRKYNELVFRKYLMKHSTTKLDTRESFLILQAEYLVLMYRHENKKINKTSIQSYREFIIKTLLDEDKEFMEIQEDVEKEMEKTKKENDNARRKKLFEIIMEKRNFC